MISARLLAPLYTTLAQGERAGLPRAQQLAACVGVDKRLDQALLRAGRAVRGGMALAEAGRRAGLWPGPDDRHPRAWEYALIYAGETGGALTDVLQALAAHHGQQLANWRRLRGGLLLPGFLWFLWLLVGPLPALARGELTLGTYGAGVAVGVVGPPLAAWLLWRLPGWLRDAGLGRAVDRLQLASPGFGHWYRWRRMTGFLHSLALLLAAGLPAQRALELAGCLPNGLLRKRIAAALASLRAGATLAEALAGIHGLDDTAVAVAQGGEAAGSLPEALLHYCQREQAAIGHQDRQLATWAPRLLYLLLVALLAWQMASQG